MKAAFEKLCEQELITLLQDQILVDQSLLSYVGAVFMTQCTQAPVTPCCYIFTVTICSVHKASICV